MWWLLAAVALGAPRANADSYWDVVERYRRGEHTEAVADLTDLPPAAVAQEVLEVVRLKEEADRCRSCAAPDRLARLPLLAAAMLHTDRAWPGPTAVANAAHLRIADLLLQAARRRPDPDEDFARRWRLAVMLKAFARTDGTLALGLGREGLDDFPDDEDLLLAMGTLVESVASPGPGGTETLEGRGVHRDRLVEAARLLAAAAASAADPTEALVRLGRVQALLGRREATATLTSALESTSDPRLVYLARLFLGAVCEEGRRFVDAAREYQLAVAAVPAGQAARFALSHARRRQGEMGAAQQALDGALAWPRRPPDADPYWSYPWGHSGEAESMLAGLREAVR